MRWQRIAVAAAILLLPGVVVAPAWRLGGLGPAEDDVLYYFPARVFFHEAVQAGEFPTLNPWTGLGRPYLADPQAAVWYPTTWLFAALPPVGAYGASLWLHYSLAIWGGYRLLRGKRLGVRAALFGGIVFAFCGFMLAHRAHFTMQHAAAWAPWVVWRVDRYLRASNRSTPGASLARMRRLLAAVLVVTLQCLSGHVQVAAITAAGVFALAVARRPGPGRRVVGLVSLRWLVTYVCAAGLFAVQWLPTYAYVRECTRVDRSYWDFVENSYVPMSLLTWVTPMLTGQRTPNLFDVPYWAPSHQCEQFGYVGFLPLLLALVALRAGWRGNARRRPWGVLIVVMMLVALGGFGPVCPFLYWLPGSSLFRCPARALVLVHLALAVLAAMTLDDLGRQPTRDRVRTRAALLRWADRPRAIAIALVGGSLLVALPIAALLGGMRTTLLLIRPWNPALVVPLLVILVSLGVLGHALRHWRQPRRLWLVPLVTVLDLGIIGWTIDLPRGANAPRDLLEPGAKGTWLSELDGTPSRLWVVTERVAGKPGEYIASVDKAVANTNILRGIRSLTDYGPLQPRAFVAAFGFQPWGESWKAAELLADTRWMRACNVEWVLLCEPGWQAPAACDLVATTDDGWRLYRYAGAGGDVVFDDPARPGCARLEWITNARFRVAVDTWPSTASARTPEETGPVVLISQLAMPGWSARVGGRAWPIGTAAEGVMRVALPPGETTTLDFEYHAPGLRWGAAVSLATAIVLLLGAGYVWRQARRHLSVASRTAS